MRRLVALLSLLILFTLIGETTRELAPIAYKAEAQSSSCGPSQWLHAFSYATPATCSQPTITDIRNGTASVATNNALITNSTSVFPKGVFRLGINNDADAPPLFFRPQTGSCASHGMVSDIGGCNDTTTGDGNSWQAVYTNPTQILVTQFGVWADNNANDYSAPFQNAINYLCKTEAGVRGFFGTGGEIIVPGGGGAQIAVRSGINTGCPGGIGGVSIVGESRQYSAICACTGDTVVITLNGTLSSLRNLSIYGTNAPGLTSTPLGPAITNLPSSGGTFAATHAAIVIGSTAVGYDISNIDVWGGYYSIWNQGGDGRTWYVGAHEGYGDANVRNSSASASAGGQWDQASIDQGTTGLPLPPSGTNLAAWASGTHYSADALATVSYNGSTYVIEASNGGTSGGSSPPVCNYLVPCNDNGILWFLVNQLNNAALDDDGSSVDFYISNADISGLSTYAILVTNRGGGSQPTFFKCIACTLGSFDSAVKIQEGNTIYIAYSIGGSFLGNAAAVTIDSTYTGTATFTSNNLSAYAIAVTANAGSPADLLFVGNVFTTSVTNNEILDNVAAGATFSFTDNVVNSASAGTVGIDVAGAATGGQIKNNTCVSAILPANCVQNNSSGSNLISGNTGDGADINIGVGRNCVKGINANSANTDTMFNLSLPRGILQYRLGEIKLSNPTIPLTTATFGVFSATGGGGTAVVASGTALSPLSGGVNSTGSLFLPTIINRDTSAYNFNPLYLRIQTAQGATAGFDACINYEALAQ